MPKPKKRPIPPGKPKKFSNAQIEEALEKCHGVVTYAAKYLGCSRNTLNNYLNREPTLKVFRDNATQILADKLEMTGIHRAFGVIKEWVENEVHYPDGSIETVKVPVYDVEPDFRVWNKLISVYGKDRGYGAVEDTEQGATMRVTVDEVVISRKDINAKR